MAERNLTAVTPLPNIVGDVDEAPLSDIIAWALHPDIDHGTIGSQVMQRLARTLKRLQEEHVHTVTLLSKHCLCQTDGISTPMKFTIICSAHKAQADEIEKLKLKLAAAFACPRCGDTWKVRPITSGRCVCVHCGHEWDFEADPIQPPSNEKLQRVDLIKVTPDTCEQCHGGGKIGDEACPECGGYGKVWEAGA